MGRNYVADATATGSGRITLFTLLSSRLPICLAETANQSDFSH